MAFSTDTSVDFATSVGYTFNASNVTISGGVATLAAAVTGTHTVETPEIDTSAWLGINRVEVDATEEAGYTHRFLVSFDGGITFMRHRHSEWLTTPEASIGTKGMTIRELDEVREWGVMQDGLIFLVSMTRADAAKSGEISGFTVYYLAAAANTEDHAVIGEPAATGDLEADLAIQPDFPLAAEELWPHEAMVTDGNYDIVVRLSTKPRKRVNLTWSGLTATQRDSVLEFLEDHREAAFTWTSGGFNAMTAGNPIVTKDGPTLFAVSCPIVQVHGG